jgi:hypothetical protein
MACSCPTFAVSLFARKLPLVCFISLIAVEIASSQGISNRGETASSVFAISLDDVFNLQFSDDVRERAVAIALEAEIVRTPAIHRRVLEVLEAAPFRC